MDRVRGRRFENEPKLNIKKVFATIIAIIVIIMVIKSIIKLLNKDKKIDANMQIPKKYFTMYENEKYGVIDGEGNVIVKPTYDEMIIIPNNNKPVFICTYDVDYEQGTYKTKVLNEKSEEILKKFENIMPIENSDNDEIWYEDNILKYEENGMFGLIDFSGKEIIPAEYSNIYSLDGISKSIVIEKDGLKGIVNSNLSNVIVECKYNEISSLNLDEADDGYIVVLDGKYGVVSGTGKEILACNYSDIKHIYGNNMYVVKEDNNYKIINDALTTIKDNEVENVIEINREFLTIESNGLKGVINNDGTELIPIQYEDLKYAYDNYFIAKKDGLYGIISTENTVLLDFGYQSISFINSANIFTAETANYTTDVISRKFEVKLSHIIISEFNNEKSYIRVRKDGDYHYYNFNLEEKKNTELLNNNTLYLVKKDGKYGYINKNGELVVNYIYDDAKEQNEFGYCVVKQNGVWGVLGQDGTIILKPSVNLDNNLYIDFISKWHLFNDKDMYIYVK